MGLRGKVVAEEDQRRKQRRVSKDDEAAAKKPEPSAEEIAEGKKIGIGCRGCGKNRGGSQIVRVGHCAAGENSPINDESYSPISEFTLLAVKIGTLMREGKIKTKADMAESLKFILMEVSKRPDSSEMGLVSSPPTGNYEPSRHR